MSVNWKKLNNKVVIFCLFIPLIFHNCNTINDKEEKYKKVGVSLIKIIPKLSPNQNIIVLTSYSCLTCNSGKLLYAINRYANKSYKLLGLVFNNTKNFSGLEDIAKNTAFNIVWQETNNIDLMRQLSTITEDKVGPYFIQFKNDKIVTIETLPR